MLPLQSLDSFFFFCKAPSKLKTLFALLAIFTNQVETNVLGSRTLFLYLRWPRSVQNSLLLICVYHCESLKSTNTCFTDI